MINIELNASKKLLARLEEGIDLSKLSLGDLVLLSADTSEDSDFVETQNIVLNEEDSKAFLKALESPIEPTEALIDLFRENESE
jgi:uncharacterized protein (DUF1778 family)